jgi:hypothetical protein
LEVIGSSAEPQDAVPQQPVLAPDITRKAASPYLSRTVALRLSLLTVGTPSIKRR